MSTERAAFDWASKRSYLALAQTIAGCSLARIDSLAMEGFNRQAVTELLTRRGPCRSSEWVSLSWWLSAMALVQSLKKTRQPLDQLVT